MHCHLLYVDSWSFLHGRVNTIHTSITLVKNVFIEYIIFQEGWMYHEKKMRAHIAIAHFILIFSDERTLIQFWSALKRSSFTGSHTKKISFIPGCNPLVWIVLLHEHVWQPESWRITSRLFFAYLKLIHQILAHIFLLWISHYPWVPVADPPWTLFYPPDAKSPPRLLSRQ